MNEILCIDIGGSKFIAGAVTPEGKVLYTQKYVWQGHGAQNIVRQLFHGVDELVSHFPQQDSHIPFGITIPGFADPDAGIWLSSSFLGIQALPIAELFQKRYGRPVVLDNDANACALAEHRFGAGRDVLNFLYMTISNSIGGAFFLDGKLWQGSRRKAGEIGMLPTDDLAAKPPRRMNLEDLASGRGLSRTYRRLCGEGTEESLPADRLMELAVSGDKNARKAFDIEGIYLARAIAQAAFLTDPGLVILGGGVTLAYSMFEDTLHRELRREMLHAPSMIPEVRATPLGYLGALLGAASLALGKMEEMAHE